MCAVNPRRWPSCGVFFRFLEHAQKIGVNKHQKHGGMDHESEISFANRTHTCFRVNVSIVASECRLLDDLPSWIHGNSERHGDAEHNRDSGTSRLT